MNDFNNLLYVVEVSPDFYQVRISALEHLVVSSVTGYGKALNCVREFVLNYKTPDNLIKEMRDLVKHDRDGDKHLREKDWINLSSEVKMDISDTVDKAYHDPDYKKRRKFESVSMRTQIEEEEKKTEKALKTIMVMPKKTPKMKKRKPILHSLV